MSWLLTLGIIGASAIVTSRTLITKASERPDLRPTMFGMDAGLVGGLGGLLGAALLPGIFAPMAAGVALGSLIAKANMGQVKKDLDQHQLETELQDGVYAPPVQPGEPAPQEQPPRWSLWNWLAPDPA